MDNVQIGFLVFVFFVLLAFPSIQKLVDLAREQRKKHFEEQEKEMNR